VLKFKRKFRRLKVKDNIKTSAQESLYEFKQHKPWLNEDCLRLLEQIKQAKIQL
jgi:hypothetical protein